MLNSALKIIAATHRGNVRKINQDTVLVANGVGSAGQPLALLIVADGMGGHQAGEVASQLAVRTIFEVLSMSFAFEPPFIEPESELRGFRPNPNGQSNLSPDSPWFVQEKVRTAIKEANRAIWHYAQAHRDAAGNLGTTVTCALIIGSDVTIANVGDSRTYHQDQYGLQVVTHDHSYVGYLVRTGQIAEAEIYDHPQRHLVTRSLGGHRDIQVDIWKRELAIGDRLLLCSDGFWEMVRDSAEISTILRNYPLTDAAPRLVNRANDNGGVDNISVALAERTA